MIRKDGCGGAAVEIEYKEDTKCLDSDYGAGDRIVLWNRRLRKNLQGFPGASTEIGKDFSIV
jgi:hypothetical protein